MAWGGGRLWSSGDTPWIQRSLGLWGSGGQAQATGGACWWSLSLDLSVGTSQA